LAGLSARPSPVRACDWSYYYLARSLVTVHVQVILKVFPPSGRFHISDLSARGKKGSHVVGKNKGHQLDLVAMKGKRMFAACYLERVLAEFAFASNIWSYYSMSLFGVSTKIQKI